MTKKVLLFILSAIILTVIILTLFVRSENRNVNNGAFQLKIGKDTVQSLWYYEIYQQDRLMIRQSYIPAVEGAMPFESGEQAEKIGQLVLDKLNNGTTPFLTKEDLQPYITVK